MLHYLLLFLHHHQMAPPVDAEGEGIFKPNGKPKKSVEPAGSSFAIDGYAVTYTTGMTWKFNIGFDPDAGLMLYNIRVVLPPSKAYPEGEVVPYLFKAGGTSLRANLTETC